MGKLARETFGLFVVLKLIICVLSSPIYEDEQLYAGSPCTLSGRGGNGTCVKFEDCPSKMREVHEGRYDQSDRCGFEDFVEIVCCGSPNITDKLNTVNPADSACQEYGNDVSQTGRSVSFHILGGVDAEPNEFPQMAAIGYAPRPGDDSADIRYTCGGTLVSRQHVLTAAHCVNNRDEDVPVEVRLGSTDLTDAGDSIQRVPVLSVTSHPGYKRSRNYNDLAIIKLQEPVRLSNSVQPACLLTKSLRNIEANTNQTLIVVGWGSTEFVGDGSPKLKKAVGLRFVEFDECSRNYENKTRLPNGLDLNTMVCAIDPDRTRQADTCTGDSGGPLFMSSSNSQPIVAAVTAFGQGCGGSTPSVYTSIYDYLPWIESQVWPNSEKGSKRSI